MNYFNPYYMSSPVMSAAPRVGILKNLFGGLNFSNILSGTSKTLNVVNQALPLIKQAGPMLNNAKTMFKVMNEFKKVETPVTQPTEVSKTEEIIQKEEPYTRSSHSGPTFFL